MHIHVNEVYLFYDVYGDGPPLILLHGNGEDHHIFDAIGARLASHYRLYALDSRNHGRSERTDRYDYGVMADDLLAFIQALELAPVRILGFSDGAIVSLLLALRRSEVVSKMALLGVNLSPRDFTAETYAEIEQAYKKTCDPLCKLMLEQPDIPLDALKSVQISTLIVGAEHDIYRSGLFHDITTAMPAAQVLILQGHSHDSYIIGQDLLYPQLHRFFA